MLYYALNEASVASQGTGWDEDAKVQFQDPMKDPLPNAPSMRLICVYGVNKPVERCECSCA